MYACPECQSTHLFISIRQWWDKEIQCKVEDGKAVYEDLQSIMDEEEWLSIYCPEWGHVCSVSQAEEAWRLLQEQPKEVPFYY